MSRYIHLLLFITIFTALTGCSSIFDNGSDSNDGPVPVAQEPLSYLEDSESLLSASEEIVSTGDISLESSWTYLPPNLVSYEATSEQVTLLFENVNTERDAYFRGNTVYAAVVHRYADGNRVSRVKHYTSNYQKYLTEGIGSFTDTEVVPGETYHYVVLLYAYNFTTRSYGRYYHILEASVPEHISRRDAGEFRLQLSTLSQSDDNGQSLNNTTLYRSNLNGEWYGIINTLVSVDSDESGSWKPVESLATSDIRVQISSPLGDLSQEDLDYVIDIYPSTQNNQVMVALNMGAFNYRSDFKVGRYNVRFSYEGNDAWFDLVVSRYSLALEINRDNNGRVVYHQKDVPLHISSPRSVSFLAFGKVAPNGGFVRLASHKTNDQLIWDVTDLSTNQLVHRSEGYSLEYLFDTPGHYNVTLSSLLATANMVVDYPEPFAIRTLAGEVITKNMYVTTKYGAGFELSHSFSDTQFHSNAYHLRIRGDNMFITPFRSGVFELPLKSIFPGSNLDIYNPTLVINIPPEGVILNPEPASDVIRLSRNESVSYGVNVSPNAAVQSFRLNYDSSLLEVTQTHNPSRVSIRAISDHTNDPTQVRFLSDTGDVLRVLNIAIESPYNSFYTALTSQTWTLKTPADSHSRSFFKIFSPGAKLEVTNLVDGFGTFRLSDPVQGVFTGDIEFRDHLSGKFFARVFMFKFGVFDVVFEYSDGKLTLSESGGTLLFQ